MPADKHSKLQLPGNAPAEDPARIVKIAGLGDLDEETLLGALLNTAVRLREGYPNSLHESQAKGAEALRILKERAKGR